ncbi:MAG: hypothetical protein H7222_16355, partial [Methylotenera sp.]|nr:hypothetical protein [Oligoflexia bacterium]
LSTVYAKPLPSRMIELLNAQPSAVLITVEDGSVIGGFGQHLFSSLEPRSARTFTLGYRDHFIPHGSVGDLEESEGLSEKALSMKLAELL